MIEEAGGQLHMMDGSDIGVPRPSSPNTVGSVENRRTQPKPRAPVA